MNHFKYKKSRFTREYSCPEFYKVSVHQKLMVVYKARKCKANEVEGNKSWCKMIMKLLLIRCCLHPGENGVATFIVWIEWEAKQKSEHSSQETDSIWGLNKIHFQWISTFLWKVTDTKGDMWLQLLHLTTSSMMTFDAKATEKASTTPTIAL